MATVLKLKLFLLSWFYQSCSSRHICTVGSKLFQPCLFDLSTFTLNQNATAYASTCSHLIQALQQMACDYILSTPATFASRGPYGSALKKKYTNNKVVVENGASSTQRKTSNTTARQRLPSITHTHTEVQISIILTLTFQLQITVLRLLRHRQLIAAPRSAHCFDRSR